MFARHNLIVGLGSTMGLAICSMLVSSVGYGTLLSLCAPLVFVSFLVAFFVIKDPPLYVGRWLSRIGRSVDDVETLSFWFGSKGFRLKPTVDMTLFGVGTVIFAIASSSALLSLPIYLSDIILMTPSMTFAVFIFPSLFGRSGILRNLKVSQTAASGVGEQYVYTVRITGVDTSITCTIAGAADTTGEDVTHTEVVNSGDHVSIKVVSSGGAGANRPRISLDFEPD